MHEENNNLANFEDLIQQLPVPVALLDLNSRINCSNDYSAKIFGYQKKSQLIGIGAPQMRCPAVKFADTFINQDRQVIATGAGLTILDIHTYAHDMHKQLLTNKIPYIKNGEIVGTTYYATEIHSKTLSQLCSTLITSDKQYYHKKKGTDRSYIFGTILGEKTLSKREKDCVFYLLRGKTAKETSKSMDISFRTVETHIQNIKNKLGCDNRSDIIEYALANGYLNYVPQNLICADISCILDVKHGDAIKG